MFEEEFSKQDKAFKTFLIIALKIMEVVAYVGIGAVWVAVAWAIWKSGWEEWSGMIWPALGACVILVGSIWGIKFLKRLVA